MSEVVVHAGRRKAGSTSIQRWLVENAQDLRKAQIVVALPRDAPPPGPMIEPCQRDITDAERDAFFTNYARGMFRLMRALRGLSVQAAPPDDDEFIAAFPHFPRALDANAMDRLCDELAMMAANSERVVLSAESFDEFLFQDDIFLSALESLASRHRVRIAYYLVPQHLALEREWRFQGFRLPLEPSEWVRRFAPVLGTEGLLERSARIAPNVELSVRPFHDELLRGGAPVSDFSAEFLAIGQLQDAVEIHENAGLSLDLVIALRSAPPKLIGWGRLGFESRIGRLRQLAGFDIGPSQRVLRSREVLQAFAYQEFAASNRSLVEKMGRPEVELVPDPGIKHWKLDELDELWRSGSDPVELELLHAALIAATD